MLTENLKKWFYTVCIKVNSYIEEIKRAKTVEEIMYYKKRLILNYLCNIPLDASTCYFCIHKNNVCENCLYAKYHKPCGNSDSDYCEIKRELRKLLRLIDEKYYNDEVYKEE